MSALVNACLQLEAAQNLLERAKDSVEREAQKFRGKVPVRAVARETGLSACTVSNFYRGRLVVSAENALKLAQIAERFQVRP